MHYLLLLLLLITSCATTNQSVKVQSSLDKYDLKGKVQYFRQDTVITTETTLRPTVQVNFNESGMKTSSNFQYNNDQWEVTYSYEYDSLNQLRSKRTPHSRTTYSYNEKGQLTVEMDSDYDGESSTYYFYDKSGNRIKDSAWYRLVINSYEGDQLVKKCKTDPRDKDNSTEPHFTYFRRNEQGQILEEWDGAERFNGYICTYDSVGNMTSKIERRSAEVPFGKGEFSYKTTWEYDDHQEVTKVTRYSKNSRKPDRSWNYRFEYDSYGNWITRYYIYLDGRELKEYQREIKYYELSNGTAQ